MVSIIIPVFNGEAFISKSIESIINQSYKDIEIIVIDDGSIDNTAEIVKGFNRVKYYFQNNMGPAAARNNGIRLSQGNFIAFQDADDVSLPNRIERQREFFREYPDIDIVYNSVNIIDDQDKILSTLRSEGIYNNTYDFLAMTLFRQVIPCPPSIMVRRKCFETVKYPEQFVNAEDYLFTIELAKKFKFKYLDEILYLYRRHQGNLTNKHNKQLENEIAITENFGIDNIHDAINKTTFDILTKALLTAKILIKVKCYTEAISLLESNVLLHNNEYMWFYLGVCYYNIENYQKAKDCFEKSIYINKKLAEAHNNLGCCFACDNNFEQAIYFFNNATKIKNGYHDPIQNIEMIASGCSNYKLTLRELRQTLSQYKET